MFLHAIPQIAPGRRGIHVLWAGPRQWLYSPKGWTIQRRVFQRGRPRIDCVWLAEGELAGLRARHEWNIRHGVLTLRRGPWLVPTAVQARAASTNLLAEIITLQLAAPQTFVRIDADGSAVFAVGLRDGKVVAGGEVKTGQTTHLLVAPQIDTVVTYATGLTRYGACLRTEDLSAWNDVPVVKELQLPIRELMPSLPDADAEFVEAKSRLPDETLDPEEFASLADNLRLLVREDGPPRPMDLALLLRERGDEDPQ
jgi:hypothetical protein